MGQVGVLGLVEKQGLLEELGPVLGGQGLWARRGGVSQKAAPAQHLLSAHRWS